jgi:SAM-dependent methyltransferase
MISSEYDRFAEFYDDVVPYRQRADAAFYLDLAARANGPTLEVGCGTGRLLVPLARAGVTIDGLDASPAMLDVCRDTLAREAADVQARVRLHLDDMRSFTMDRAFGLVMVPFRAFQHMLTVDDQLAALASFRSHLLPGGRLALDVFNPSLPFLTDQRITVEAQSEPEFVVPDGRRVVRKYRIAARDYFTQTQDVEFIHDITHPDGRREEQRDVITLRYVFRYELEHLLARAGFTLETVQSDFSGSPYGSIYPGDLIAVARLSADT